MWDSQTVSSVAADALVLHAFNIVLPGVIWPWCITLTYVEEMKNHCSGLSISAGDGILLVWHMHKDWWHGRYSLRFCIRFWTVARRTSRVVITYQHMDRKAARYNQIVQKQLGNVQLRSYTIAKLEIITHVQSWAVGTRPDTWYTLPSLEVYNSYV